MDLKALYEQFRLFPSKFRDEWPPHALEYKGLGLQEFMNPELTLWFWNKPADGYYEYVIFPTGETDSTKYLALFTGFSGVRVLSMVDADNRLGTDWGFGYHILWREYSKKVDFVIDRDATIWSHSSKAHFVSKSDVPFDDAVFDLLREKAPFCLELGVPDSVTP